MNGRTLSSLRPATGALMSVEEAGVLLRGGGAYTVAGEEALLRRLPRGRWIGGTIPYFMGQDGGRTTREQVFVTALPAGAGEPELRWYDDDTLAAVCTDAPANGFSLVVDGQFKAHYDNENAAQEAGAELLGRFPMLQVLIYDAETRIRSPLQ